MTLISRVSPRSLLSLTLLTGALGLAFSGCAANTPSDGDADDDGDGIPNSEDPDYMGTGGGNNGTGGGLDVDGGNTGGTQGEVECTTDPVTGEKVCVCVKLVTWGGLGTYGAVPGMDGQDAIGAWLNENSTGDADYTAAKPAITAEYLAAYNIIVIQDISSWPAFTAEEKAAFEAWVRGGGGVMSLNGYSANGNEMANVNDLLAFTTMSYVASSDTSNEADRAALLGVCEDCYGASVPQAGWSTHPIGLNVKKVGAFHGRAVTAGSGEVVAQEGVNVLGAAAGVDAGRVFVFHDEWITYNSQWTGAGLVTDCRQQEFSGPNQECLMEHPVLQYTLPQFWYNSLKWLSGDKACFDIEDGTIVK